MNKKEQTSTFGTSINNYKWELANYDERLALALYQRLKISELTARIMAIKGVSLDKAEDYLNPTVRNNLPDPFHLLDMEHAVKHIVDAIVQKKNIVIFGDYDVDGATSSSLLKRFLRMLGIEASIYIPDRQEEGYGPNTEAFLKLKENGTDLVVTVDCGTVAFEPLLKAHEAGLDVVVIDHHLGATEKPKALAVVNPNRLDDTSEHGNLAAVGVTFLLCVGINKVLRELRHFESNKIPEPNLISLLDLVALGTVCDVVPLTGLNRSLVTQGLRVMKNRSNTGLRALSDIVGIDEVPNVYHMGFVFGPRINAGGRIGKSHLGSVLLSTEDSGEAMQIASELDELNRERKKIEDKVLEEVISQLEEGNFKTGYSFTAESPVIFAVGKDWHQGVIGIVASRIKDRYGKPAAIISIDGKTGIGKASCRSVYGVDFGAAIVDARMQELLLEGGGHEMAGGFSVENHRIEDLHKFFVNKLEEKVRAYADGKTLKIDIVANLDALNLKLVKEIDSLGPYGAGNHKPKVAVRDATVIKAEFMGSDQNHLKLTLSESTITGLKGRLTAVAFRINNTPLGDLAQSITGKKVSIVGTLNINRWMEKESVQMIIDDLAF